MAQSSYVDMNKEYYNVPLFDIFSTYKVEPSMGLSSIQATNNIEKFGVNELKKVKRSFLKVVIAPIINLLIILYLISALAMALLGAGDRTTPTFLILTVNVVVAIIQQLRAEKQLKALKELSASTTTVVRDGKEIQLSNSEITVGDIIRFDQGDKIPADCRLIQALNLSMNESSLTGESEPVRKTSDIAPLGNNLDLHDQKNMVFLGTFVAVGRGSAIVVKIGSNTEIGKISTMLEESTTGDIPLRKKMNTVAKILGIGVLILLVISVIYEFSLLAQDGNLIWSEMKTKLVDSIDLGMKVMPINLPLLTTVVLLTGVLAMAKKGVIVRDLSRTESLGRVSVVCSDKTGTLTKNEMTTHLIWTMDNEYGISGFGYNPEGFIYELSTGSRFRDDEQILKDMIISGYLNNNSSIKSEKVTNKTPKSRKSETKTIWTISGLPTEAALNVLGRKYSEKIESIIAGYDFVHEYSFDSRIKRMSKIFTQNGDYYILTKGAPEWVLPLCISYQKNKEKIPLDDTSRAEISQSIKMYASAGYRLLMICNRIIEEKNIPKDLEDEKTRDIIEKELTFLGLAIILDPPREDVATAVNDCKSAGIKVIMITGDSIDTGVAIANQLDIYQHGKHNAVEGKDIGLLSDEDFLKTTVYGRVSPEHKQTIIKRYQDMDKIVSMSGDGVNDALALSMADCGLAMGIQGTEVAKEAADMVITDDSFSTIVTGVKEGRGLFMKIRTIIYFFVCVSVMESIILFGSVFIPDFVLFDYWQLNLLYVTAHMFPSLGFTFGSNSNTIMDEKPRDTAELLTKDVLKLMGIQMLLMGLSIIFAYYIGGVMPISNFNQAGITNYLDTPDASNVQYVVTIAQSKARTMGFTVLTLLESVLMPFQIRRLNKSIKDSFKDGDAFEFGWYSDSIIILIVLMYTVPLQNFMADTISWPINFMYLDIWDWIICLLLCLPTLFGVEYYKFIINKKNQIKEQKILVQQLVEDDGYITKPTSEMTEENISEVKKLIIIMLEEVGDNSQTDILETLGPLDFTEELILKCIDELKEENKIKFGKISQQYTIIQ